MDDINQPARPAASEKPRKTILIIANAIGSSSGRVLLPELRGAMEYGRSHGWDMVSVQHWRGEPPPGVQPDGLIALLQYNYREFAESWHPRVPLGVVMYAPFVCEPPYPYPIVEPDSVMIGNKAADYFFERHFQNCAVCHYDQPVRFQALIEFEERVRESGGTCANLVCKGQDGDALASQGKAIKRQLAAQPLPLAIFCVNDRLALRVCRWCLQMGLAIPEQVAILGMGNDPTACEYGPVPLSSVDPNPRQHGVEAARLLQRMMSGHTPPETRLRVPVGGIITRRSTDILAVPDADVAHALRFIWDHYRENIGVDEIAASCGISRSKLSRHFKSALKRTVVEELTRQRLEKACEMLTKGDASIVDIAAATGYRSPQYFNKCFRQSFGISPEQFRRRDRQKRRMTVGE